MTQLTPNITIFALGSRGDVQPAVALGHALQQANYNITLASYPNFAPLAAQYNLPFAPLEGDITALLQSPAGQETLNSRNPFKLFYLIRDELNHNFELTKQDALAAAQHADLIISIAAPYLMGAALAEHYNIPHLGVNLQPLAPTTDFRNPLIPVPFNTRLTNYLSHKLLDQLLWTILRPYVNQARQEFGLSPWPRLSPITQQAIDGQIWLFAHSRHLLPKPANWTPNAHVVGYFFLDQPDDWQPSTNLLQFLDAGPPPIYIGFGSMNTRNPLATGQIAIEALQLSGQRGLLHRGWGGLTAADLPDNIMMIDSVPHSWLFPRTAAVAHHCGAGTTAAGLRAGVPTIPIPFFADQPFWADLIAKKHLGPPPIPRRKLTATNLAQAITHTLNTPTYHTNATNLAQKIKTEDTYQQVITIIKQSLK